MCAHACVCARVRACVACVRVSLCTGACGYCKVSSDIEQCSARYPILTKLNMKATHICKPIVKWWGTDITILSGQPMSHAASPIPVRFSSDKGAFTCMDSSTLEKNLSVITTCIDSNAVLVYVHSSGSFPSPHLWFPQQAYCPRHTYFASQFHS